MSNISYTKNRSLWFCADFETVTANTDYYEQHEDTRVLLFNMRNWDETIVHSGVSIQEWWEYVRSFKSSMTIFFHNLKFDGDFILKYLANHTNLKCDFDNQRRNNTFQVFRNGGRIYYISIYMRVRTGKRVKDVNIIIRDSLLMLSNSIETLGKSLGLHKHHPEDDIVKFDGRRYRKFYDLEPVEKLEDLPKRFVEYCENDTKIALYSLQKFESMVNGLQTIDEYNERVNEWNEQCKVSKYKKSTFSIWHSMTVASLTKRIMKLYAGKEFLQIDKETHEEIGNWFMGGWTQINDDYLGNPKSIKRGLMFDVVSAYPFQMTKPLPYGRLLDEQPEDCDFYEFMHIRVRSAKIKDKYKNAPILVNWNKRNKNGSFDASQRYVREMKNFDCFYIRQEWEMIKKYYDVKVDEMQSKFMRATNYLQEYIKEIYAEKEYYSNHNNAAMKQVVKILLNSGYGCLAIRDKFDSFMYFPSGYLHEKFGINYDSDRDKQFTLFIGEHEKTFEYKYQSSNYWISDDYDMIVCRDTYEKEMLTNKAAACVITALERCYLWELIDKVGAKHFGYSDTDSVLFINLDKKKYEYCKTLTGNQLGDWEIEKDKATGNADIHYFGTFGAKQYALLDEHKNIMKLRIAGIDQRLTKIKDNFSAFNLDEDEIHVKNAILRAEYKKSGIVFHEVDKILKKTGI